MQIFNAAVTSKQNFIKKYHRLKKNLYFIFILLFFTSNECFSHFNVQQLHSNISHFVLFSHAHLKITFHMLIQKKQAGGPFIWDLRVVIPSIYSSAEFKKQSNRGVLEKGGLGLQLY